MTRSSSVYDDYAAHESPENISIEMVDPVEDIGTDTVDPIDALQELCQGLLPLANDNTRKKLTMVRGVRHNDGQGAYDSEFSFQLPENRADLSIALNQILDYYRRTNDLSLLGGEWMRILTFSNTQYVTRIVEKHDLLFLTPPELAHHLKPPPPRSQKRRLEVENDELPETGRAEESKRRLVWSHAAPRVTARADQQTVPHRRQGVFYSQPDRDRESHAQTRHQLPIDDEDMI